MKTHNKSQAWSIDFVIGISVFMGALVIFYTLLNPASNEKPIILQKDASFIAKEVEEEESPLTVMEGNIVNETKLDNLIGRYSSIKKNLGIKNDFCIYFEDENGNIMPIKEGVTGIGSSDIKIGGIQCK